MTLTVIVIAGVIALVGGGIGFVRRAELEPDRWHVDPLTAPKPDTPNSYRVAPATVDVPIDAEAATYSMPVSELATRFDAVALAAPRTIVAAGSAADGFVTYVQRSALWGFPDYVSVKFLEADADGGGGSTLAVFSRSRFGKSDLGVNKKRVTTWLAALPA